MCKKYRLEIPGHISGFWYIVKASDPLHTGSLGAGLILEPGLLVEVLDDDNCIIEFNDMSITINTYIRANELANIPCSNININSPYELGVGYGISAGITLGGLFFSLVKKGVRKSWFEIGRYAHIAEVENVTGYGDVIAEISGGGVELRRMPGAPGIGSVDKIPVSKHIKVITIEMDRYSTKKMFDKYGGKIQDIGEKAYNSFIEDPSIEKFGEISHWFSLETGMMTYNMDKKIKNVLFEELRNGNVLDFFIKKGLLVVITEESGYLSTYEDLKKLGDPKVFSLNFSGCRLV